MTLADPERHYQSGLTLLNRGRYHEAVTQFQAALESEKERGAMRPQMRYLSYYGLSRALANRPTPEDVQICERAAAQDSFDATLLLNLGKVYLLTGKTTKALATFERGMKLDPNDRSLRAMFRRADRRARPPLPMLGRDHPLNRSLGRLRASLRRQSKTATG